MFVGNTAVGSALAGGMAIWEGSATLTGCTFRGNSADDWGGLSLFVRAVLIDTTLCGNWPDQINGGYTDGGGNYIDQVCPPAPPVIPTGACCLNGGACMVGTDADCTAVGGTYVGDDVSCATAGCAEPWPADISGPDGAPDGCVDPFDLNMVLAAWCSTLGGNPCGTCGP